MEQLPAQSLDERYGRRRARPVRRWVAVAAGAVLCTLALAWGAWVAYRVSTRPLTWQNVGYDARADDRTDVTFDVHFNDDLPADSNAVCTIRALNHVRAEVGLRDVTVGPASRGSVRSTVAVPTSERAVTGMVKECIPRP